MEGVSTLEACALHLSVHLGRSLTVSALQDANEGDNEQGRDAQIRAVMRAAGRVGIHAAFGKRSLADLSDGFLPAILIMNGDCAVVIHELGTDQVTLYDPQQDPNGTGVLVQREVGEIDRHFSGYILSLSLQHRHELSEHVAGTGSHWFRDAFKANLWAYAQVALASLMVNVMALVTALFTMVVYDRILPSGAMDSLFALTLGVGIALVFDVILKTLRAGFLDHSGKQADLAMGDQLYEHLLETEMSARKGSVGTISATMKESETLRDFFTSATLMALVDLPFVVIFVSAIFFLAGPLALVPAIVVPMVLAIGFTVQPVLGRLSDLMLAEGQAKQAVLVETLNGIETIKAVGAARQMRSRWAQAIRRQASYAVRNRTVTQGVINVTGFVQQSAQVLIVVYGAVLVISGQITSGVLIAAVILTGRALAPLALISQTLTRLHQARSSYRSLNALMQAPAEHDVGRRFLSRPSLSGNIRFDGVSFAYPGQHGLALDDVSFNIGAGEHVAIMGPVGSGKSTIARLILGLYRPTEGTVLIDGIDIRQLDPTDLRRNVGSVLQDTWLLSGTLRENIALGCIRPLDTEILAAAKLAGVESFAAGHPEGYEMQIGERGQGLSGGQRQAVALARGLIGDPSILLLDEPSSAMDIQSEIALIAQLKQSVSDRTLVVITHRVSLLDLVDRVIVLHRGKVAFDGPKELVLRNSVAAGVAS